MSATLHAMDHYKKPYQLAIVNNYFDLQDIATTVKTMTEIQERKLDYDDYAQRRGGIWSDVKVKRGSELAIIKEYATKKVSLVNDQLHNRNLNLFLIIQILRLLFLKRCYQKCLML